MGDSLSESELAEIARRTVGHYSTSSDSFWEGTRDHDVSQNIEALLRNIHGGGPHRILDFGCGPGRDCLAMKALGHDVTGLDGCAEFVAMAQDYSGCTVLHQDFLALALPEAGFDGVFANASLFHVPTQSLGKVLGDLWRSLAPQGVLFCSNPRGGDVEGWNGERYGAYHSLDTWRTLLEGVGFREIEHYYRPVGRPRSEQPWLATVWRKVAHGARTDERSGEARPNT